MTPDPLFRRLVFAQVLFGIIAFCMAEPGGNPALLLVAGTLAALSWYVVEGPSGKPLPQWMIHMGAFAAVGWLVFDLRREADQVVLAMGHFTMWLQIVQLYGQKTNREYALLLVLSLLQVVGASMISVSMLFGVILIAYCALALFTVLLFQLKMTADRVREWNRTATPRRKHTPRPKPVFGRGHRWQFRMTAVTIGLVCALVASVTFVLMPRRPARMGAGGLPFSPAQVGLSQTVRLDSAPQVGNPTPVMNVSVARGGQPVGGDGAGWLMRVYALDQYSQTTQQWSRSVAVASLDHEVEVESDGLTVWFVPDGPNVIDMDVTLRTPGQFTLPTPYPYNNVAGPRIDSFTFNPVDQQVTAPRVKGTLRYSVRKPPSRWADVLAKGYGELAPLRDESLERFRASYAHGWPEPSATRLRDEAFRVMGEAGLDRDIYADHDPRDERIVRALALHLRTNYEYSLDNPRSQDAINDFLFDHQRGHCELFAASLAAMARSVGMRARVVTGFLVNEYNDIGDYYVVRQADAHAWTEIDLGERGWVAFDATPPSDVAAEHAVDDGLFTPLRELYEHLEFTWLGSVVSFDADRRERMMDDLSSSVRDAADDRDSWFGTIVNWFKMLPKLWRSDRLAFIVSAVAIVAIVVGIGSLIQTWLRRRKRLAALQLTRLPRKQRRALARRLGFYLHMLDLLERHGHIRPAWQSPAKFAEDLVGLDAERFSPAVALTEQFYEVRFGHRPVDMQRRTVIREQLRALENALSERRRGKEPEVVAAT